MKDEVSEGGKAASDQKHNTVQKSVAFMFCFPICLLLLLLLLNKTLFNLKYANN